MRLPTPFRRTYVNALTSGAHLLLVLFAVQAGTREAWLGSLSAIALISFLAWAGNVRRQRLIGDTPTSRVASAAQGYAEFEGYADFNPGTQLLSKLTSLPCVWYRYVVERRTDNDKWERLDAGESDDTFLLRDGSGDCVIDPDGAEIITRHKQVWHDGEYRYTEWRLLPKGPLYAIGEFVTFTGATAPLGTNEDVGSLLTDWKQDRGKLLERFDLNRDGQIDMQEWALARAEAKRQVARRQEDLRSQTGATNVLRAPGDGRLYLLSNLDPEVLARKYRLWGIAHLVIFMAAGIAVAWLSAHSLPRI
jgi:hypothetical protein